MKRLFHLTRITHRASHEAPIRLLTRLSLPVLLALILALVGAFSGPAAPVKVAHATGTPNGWTPTNGSMNVARAVATATLLQNGKVLVAGGIDNAGNPLASAELYDPSSGTWSTTGSMNSPRYNHTATLLNDGTVLVAGGEDSVGNRLSTAEFYSAQAPDTTSPTLSLPGTITVDATSADGATVIYTVTATDPDDAANTLTISCAPLSGSAFPVGTTTVHCTARDNANNTTSGSFQVVVVGASGQLTALNNLIDGFNLQEGWETSLDVKMQQAINAVSAGDTISAHNDLIALSHEVSAQTGKKLTTGQASQIQAAITQIQHVLGY